MNKNNPLRLAVDIGGTFTDVVLEKPDKETISHKLLTNHDNPEDSVLLGIELLLDKGGHVPEEVGVIIHGTTLATNALIERRGARTAFLTTRGHRDTLEIAHEERFEQYDIDIERAKPLVPRHLRIPIEERIDRDGNVLIPLNPSSIIDAIKTIDTYKIESVAVGYLHSYVNPSQEEMTRKLLTSYRPELTVSLSSEVAPEIREYERFSTTACNAYVRPLISTYLNKMHEDLQKKGLTCPFLLMTSGGGLTTLETASKFPIRLVESGPAGGAILASKIAKQLSQDSILSFDMGGTTAKLCLIDRGKPRISRQFEIDRSYRFKKGSGLPLKIPVVEMVEIGAGGGSIARVDKMNRIKVGPESAGSDPGPSCYDLGGKNPAVTDADLLLGKIVSSKFPFDLSIKNSENSIAKNICEKLNISEVDAAYGITEVVDENMANAARAHATEYGLDISLRDLVAFGGSAPMHAARLGEKLNAKRILIPKNAAVGSALGFLLASSSYEVVRSRRMNLENFDSDEINKVYKDMRKEAFSIIDQAAPGAKLRETRQASMRYCGQGHELNITIPNKILTRENSKELRNLFESEYMKLYGYGIERVNIEVLSWSLTLMEDIDLLLPEYKAREKTSLPEPSFHQRFFDIDNKEFIDIPVYERELIDPSNIIEGPALVTEKQTTTVLPTGFNLHVDKLGNIVMEKKNA
ncbi:MAG: methylhydantoinase [Gammaproteobacteria bacterium]|nr:methylhydantoinase [Gammaproteobacteria bacterium]